MSLSTREKIISVAEREIQYHGYNAFSYHTIAEALGVKNAAIHYHFPKKDDLLEEVVNQALVRFHKLTSLAELQDKNCTERLHRFLKIYDDNLDRDNRVCLIGSLATDFFTLPDIMHGKLEVLVTTMKTWLAQVLDEGRVNGEFKFNGAANDRAALVCSSMAGALQLARILGESEYKSIKTLLLKDIKS